MNICLKRKNKIKNTQMTLLTLGYIYGILIYSLLPTGEAGVKFNQPLFRG